MIEGNGIEICTDSFGDPADPTILLVMGAGGSMLSWDEFCQRLADAGRFVIRYEIPNYEGSTTWDVLDAYRARAHHPDGRHAHRSCLPREPGW